MISSFLTAFPVAFEQLAFTAVIPPMLLAFSILPAKVPPTLESCHVVLQEFDHGPNLHSEAGNSKTCFVDCSWMR